MFQHVHSVICCHVLKMLFVAHATELRVEHAWPNDLAFESLRYTHGTSLYNDPQGRNILQRMERHHQKPARTTVNTITVYKWCSVSLC